MHYVTAEEIKLEMPDVISFDNTTHDVLLRRLATQASKWVDRLCRRSFWPQYEAKLFDVVDDDVTLWIPECMEIESVEMSSDDGGTYDETLTATDYLKYGGRRMERGDIPFRKLVMSINGDYGTWYVGEASVRVTGFWGYHDDYIRAWDLFSFGTEDDPLTSTAITMTVSDADAEDAYGLPLLQVGQVLALEDELIEVEHVNRVTEAVTIRRGALGTTAVQHVVDTPIHVYRPPLLVQRCVTVQTMRWFKRSQQAYADAGASAEVGQLRYVTRIDPDIVSILGDAGLRRVVV